MRTEQVLNKIIKLCMPGQELNLSEAIEIICDCYNLAKDATRQTKTFADKMIDRDNQIKNS